MAHHFGDQHERGNSHWQMLDRYQRMLTAYRAVVARKKAAAGFPGADAYNLRKWRAGLMHEHLESASPDVLRAMVKTFADALMSAEADALCGAGYGERSRERSNSRNGYRQREWDTRAGTVELAIPKLRSGSYFPDWLLQHRRRAEQALVSVVATSYLLGVSKRRVEKLVEQLGVKQLSKSQVSEMAGTWAERGPQLVGVERVPAVYAGPERDRAADRARERDRRRVRVVVRLGADHLVTGLAEGEHRGGDGLGGARGDEDLAVGVVVEPPEPALVLGDRGAQCRDAWAGRVLVVPLAQRGDGGGEHLGRPVGVGEALPEVDGTGAYGEGGHLREDGGAERAHPVDQGIGGKGHAPSLGTAQMRRG